MFTYVQKIAEWPILLHPDEYCSVQLAVLEIRSTGSGKIEAGAKAPCVILAMSQFDDSSFIGLWLD